MPLRKLIPDVEKRLGQWKEIQDSLKKRKKSPPRKNITISREYGCEAYPLAELLKERLERQTEEPWLIFDRALIEAVSKESKFSAYNLQHAGESQMSDYFTCFMPKEGTQLEAITELAKYMNKITQDGNSIIVGHGGALITANNPNCFHFRLFASFENRCQSIAKRCQLPYKAAAELTLSNEKERAGYFESIFSKSIQDPSSYHALFDSGRIHIKKIADLIQEIIA